MANFKTAWNAFWAIFSDDEKARAWEQQCAETPQALPAPAEAPVKTTEQTNDAALHLLALMQREARFMDYLQESLDGYDDETVGAVSRKVHDDCRHTLDKYFKIGRIMAEDEQSQVTVPAGFDACRIKISGNAIGEPPYKGTVQHRGWVVESCAMPTRGASQDASVIAPAEVEI